MRREKGVGTKLKQGKGRETKLKQWSEEKRKSDETIS
jgi:hypothetical protein